MTSAGGGTDGRPAWDHPQDLSLREQARAIATGELDATELLEATLARIEERDGRAELDRRQVRRASRRECSPRRPTGPLHGVPVAVKDMFALPWRAPRDGCARNITGVRAGRVGRVPAPARRGRGGRRRDQHARARRGSTGTSPPTARVGNPVEPRALRRRVLGRLSAPRSARGSSPGRSAPTAAARSATRPRTAASPG